jgi:spermidine/putrescine transport system permease protein
MKHRQRSITPIATTVAVLVFFYLPILVLIVGSFNAARFGGTWKGFTFDWYVRLWENRPIRDALANTLVVGLLCTLVSTAIGTIGAFALHKFGGSRLQRFHASVVWLPLMLPEILMGVSLLMFFGSLGWTLGRTTMVIAHVTFCVSYVVMVVRSRLQDFDDALLEAAQDLGATWWQTTWKVLVPVILPGIAAGALLSFTLSIDDFVISFFVNGKGMTTLPIQVQGMLKRSPMGIINALSTLMVLVTFVLLIATQLLTGDLFSKKTAKK